MTMSLTRAVATAGVLAALAAMPARVAAQPTGLQAGDVYRLRTVGDVQISPDGKSAGYAFEPFYAILVPPGMPRAIMGTLADAIARAMSPPEFREQFVKIVGSEAVFNTPEQMLQMAKKEAELIDKIARAANIKEE